MHRKNINLSLTIGLNANYSQMFSLEKMEGFFKKWKAQLPKKPSFHYEMKQFSCVSAACKGPLPG